MYHYKQGQPTRQAHKGIPEGLYEEEQGLQGFFGPVSHLIRKKPSTGWVDIEGSLKPHLYDVVAMDVGQGTKRLLYNSSVTISYRWIKRIDLGKVIAERNADGDLMYFCHKGSGAIFTDYGVLHYERGQYVIIPKSLTHAVFPEEETEFLLVENRTSHYQEPDRGLVGRHAIYDPNAITPPQLESQEALLKEKNLEITQVKIKHNDEWTQFTYAESIFDVVGWKGDLYPYTLNVDHMMPLMSHRAHLPPSAHTTFVARDFVVCTFLPRPLESDEDALKVPFYHSNIDYDEVLFYHDGDFFSRDNLHAGMMTFHPAGFAHGPHPKAMQSIKKKTVTDEYAVMIDTRWPLKVDSNLESVEQKEYWKSWMK